MNWDAVAAIIGALALLFSVGGSLVLYGKLTAIVQAHGESLKEHSASLTDHEKRVSRVEGSLARAGYSD